MEGINSSVWFMLHLRSLLHIFSRDIQEEIADVSLDRNCGLMCT